MKLYVWNNPYSVAYGGSCLYAIADGEDAAREIASSAFIREYGYAPTERQLGSVDLGPPDRVHDLPYAEVYQWAE